MPKNNKPARREVLKLASGAGASLAFAGCIGSSNSGGGGKPEKLVTKSRIGYPSANTKLEYWALSDLSSQAQVNAVQKSYSEIYRNWAKDHKDTMMNLNAIAEYGQMQDKLLTSVRSGGAPGLATIDSFWVPNFYGDLTPITKSVSQKGDFFDYVTEEMKHKGEWRAAWYQTDCRALYYNKNLIDKYANGTPPETWDELIQIGKKIKQNEDIWGYMYNAGRWEATCFDNLAYYWGQGGKIVSTGPEREFVVDKPENKQKLVDTFAFMKRTVDENVTPQRVATITDYNRLHKAAMNGQTAMFLGGSFQLANLREDYSDQLADWDISKIPMKKKDQHATGAGGWTQGIFKADGAKSAATDFVAKFLDGENMFQLNKAAGGLPTRKSVYETHSYYSDDRWLRKFKVLLDKGGEARPGGSIYSSFSNQWQIAVGKMLTGNLTPEKAATQVISNTKSSI